MACQTVLSDEDVSIGLAVLTFISFLGSTVFISVSQTLLLNKLGTSLPAILPNFDPSLLASGGATSLRSDAPPGRLDEVLNIYNEGMRQIWYLALGLACLVFVASFGMEWKSVKGKKKDNTEQNAEAVELGKIEERSETKPA